MLTINRHYLELNENYLFTTVNRKAAAYREAHPEKDVIRMGIGDVTRPICPAASEAMSRAAQEVGTPEGVHGYGPEQGYGFLKDAIRKYYAGFPVALEADEIFISDGAKSDVGNILDILGLDNTVLIPDPVYPVYLDTNIMDGRKILFADANEQNGFLPLPGKDTKADIVYLCSPNNPTGAVYSREMLAQWVNWANENKALILFDAAYESFVRDEALPRSIYEIPGAKTCAIELCSLSKTAGFTGIRCGYTVVPFALEADGTPLNKLWLRRQTTKFNGVSYITQRGAEAVFTHPEQIRRNIDYYRENALVLAQTMEDLGWWYTGGKNSPYVWFRCPGGMDSWSFFDMLLEKANVVGTPGAGFGRNGEGYFRLTAFGTHENTQEAMRRLREVFGSAK